MREQQYKKGSLAFMAALLITGFLLTGCHSGEIEGITVTHPVYEKKVYETAEVRRGDLTPAISLTLRIRKLKYIDYSVTDGSLEVERVTVSVGDKVKKGDLLVSFFSEELQNTLDGYREKKDQDLLLIQHYTNLQKADKKQDYRDEIQDLRRGIRVTDMYIEETEKKIRENQIYAKKSGTITEMSPTLKSGTYEAGKALITEAYGSGAYQAETEEKEDFSVGTTVSGKGERGTCKFRLSKVERDKGGKRRLIFDALSDMSAVAEDEAFTVQWKKEPVKNCLYVDRRAVHSENGREMVYREDETGYYDAVEVETGSLVGDYIVIRGGLSEGEKVRVD